MEIRSMQHSEVSLLAIDKSVTTLASGNDLEMSDFIKVYGSYDSDILISQYNFSNPRTCTPDDEKLLELIKTNVPGAQTTSNIAESAGRYVENQDKAEMSGEQKEAATMFIRSNFPETWLYETHNMNDQNVKTLELTLPDTITTWIFTAFSLNEKGFALATPKQLMVKQDFFVKMNLPYAGRVEEILAVDTIVFNFLETDTNVELQLSIVGNATIVEIEADFSWVQLDKNVLSKTVNAKRGKGTKVTFNFLPKENGKLTFTLKAISKDKNKNDGLVRSIDIVNYGIKMYTREKYVSNFNESRPFYASRSFDNCTSLSAGVVGDIVSNALIYDYKIE